MEISIENDEPTKKLPSTEQMFLNVLLEKFKPLNTEPFAAKLPLRQKNWSCHFFCCTNDNPEESTPAFPKQKSGKNHTKKYLPYYYTAISITIILSVYSAWMYKDSSEEAGTIIAEQLNNLTAEWQNHTHSSLYWLTYIIEILKGLIQYCSLPIFALMSLDINIGLTRMLKNLLTRSSDEAELTGPINPVFLIPSIISGIFSILPPLKVAWESAKSVPEKINNTIAGVVELTNYTYGGAEFIEGINSYLNIKWLLPYYDNTPKYTRDQANAARKEASRIADLIRGSINIVIAEYAENLQKSVDIINIQESQIETQFEKILSKLDSLRGNKSTKNLKLFLNEIMFEETADESCEKSLSLCSEALKFLGKGTLYISLFAVSLAMLMNDVATAYYAGSDLLKGSIGKKIIGAIAGIFTGISTLGLAFFGLNEIRDFFSGDNTDPMKTIHPGKFILLSCCIAFMGIFSGGPTALGGITYVTEALIDMGFHSLAEWLPQVCEGLGFLGAGITDMPYCISLVSTLLIASSEQLGDEKLKQILIYMNACNDLASCIENMKIEHIENLQPIFTNGNGIVDNVKNQAK